MRRLLEAGGYFWLFVAVVPYNLNEAAFRIILPPYLQSIGFGLGLIGALVALYGVAALVSRLPAADASQSVATVKAEGGWTSPQIRFGPLLHNRGIRQTCLASLVTNVMVDMTWNFVPLWGVSVGYNLATVGAARSAGNVAGL